jgi:transposase-like protein
VLPVVTIDKATRWMLVAAQQHKTVTSAQAFLKSLHKTCLMKVNKLLTDKGKKLRAARLPHGARPTRQPWVRSCARGWVGIERL